MAMIMLTEKDFPLELQKDWLWIIKELTKFGPLKGFNNNITTGAVANTLRKIRNSTGVKIAKKIYELNYKIADIIELNKHKD